MEQLPVFKVNTVELSQPDRAYLARVGASSVSYEVYTSQSASNSQASWTVQTPSVSVGVSRRMYHRYTFELDFTGIADSTQRPKYAALTSNVFGLRQFPISNIIETDSLRLNNNVVTVQSSDIVNAVMRGGMSDQARSIWQSLFPSKMETFPSYDQTLPTPAGTENRNPFAPHGADVTQQSRGLVDWIESYTVGTLDGNINKVTIVVTEPIWVSPLTYAENDTPVLYQIQTINKLNTHSSNLKNRLFCGLFQDPAALGANNAMNAAVVSIVKCDLIVEYVSPPQAGYEIPQQLSYPCGQLDYYVSSAQSLAVNRRVIDNSESVGAAGQSTINSITLSSMPSLIYIYVSVKKSMYDVSVGATKGNQLANVFAAITKLNVNFNGYQGMLSAASPQQLYMLSVRNGLRMSWLDWSKYCGSVVVLSPGKDFGVGSLETPGVVGSYQLSYQVEYKNVIPPCTDVAGPIDYQCNTVICYDGVLRIENQMVEIMTGVLTQMDVADAIEDHDVEASAFNGMTLVGGGFWGDLWRGIKKGAQVVRDLGTKGAKIVSDVASFVPGPHAAVVKTVADTVHGVGKALGGRRGGRVGGMLTGGALLSKNQLLSRLE